MEDQPLTTATLRQVLTEVLEPFARKEDLKAFLTREEFKEELKKELKRFATKADLERFATKAHLERFATKADLERVETNLRVEIRLVDQKLERHMADTHQRFDEVNNRLDSLVGSQERMEQEQLLINHTLRGHEERIERLEGAEQP